MHLQKRIDVSHLAPSRARYPRAGVRRRGAGARGEYDYRPHRGLSRGIHPRVESEMLGHSRVNITLDLYSHVTPTTQRQAADAVDAVRGCNLAPVAVKPVSETSSHASPGTKLTLRQWWAMR